MPFDLPDDGTIEAFAMIVDMNGFALMVERAGSNSLVAQFTRDVLAGGIDAVERNGGKIVGFMGDAFYAVLTNGDSVVQCCNEIASDLDKQCEYLATIRDYSFSRPGPSVKITVEYGWLEIAPIICRFLGKQLLLIGPPVIYASRISAAGRGNRCLFGPKAVEKLGLDNYNFRGPLKIKGKRGEKEYTYYKLKFYELVEWLASYSLFSGMSSTASVIT